MNGFAAKAIEVEGGWRATDHGLPLPGLYDSEETALKATKISIDDINNAVDENQDGLITADEIDAYRVRYEKRAERILAAKND